LVITEVQQQESTCTTVAALTSNTRNCLSLHVDATVHPSNLQLKLCTAAPWLDRSTNSSQCICLHYQPSQASQSHDYKQCTTTMYCIISPSCPMADVDVTTRVLKHIHKNHWS